MRNFQDTFRTCKRSFISAFSICIAVPLIVDGDFCHIFLTDPNEINCKDNIFYQL